MSSEEPDNRLLAIAGAVSDSEDVAWEAALAGASGPEERELVAILKEIDGLAELQRTRVKRRRTRLRPHESRWGQLEVLEKLGEGASAEVFRARDPTLDRDVALKLFRRELRFGTKRRQELLAEGKNLARLHHPNVVTVLGADEHDGRVGIWMELVEGRTLAEIVQSQGPYSATEAAQIGTELLGALAAVHRKGLVHADIKSQNVKREEGGRIVLMDFSSSRGEEDAPRHPESDPTGTPLYMSPELWEGENPSVSSDIYALGVLLYYLVTADFPVRAQSIETLRQAHQQGRRHLLEDERPGLPEHFVRAVEKALSPAPRDRYPSAGAFQQALRDPTLPARAVDEPSPALPLEVRVIARLARTGVVAAALFLFLTALGFITSTALNVTLGRHREFAPESVFDWFVWGLRSLIGPAYHAVVTLAPWIGVTIILLLLAAVPPVGRFLSELSERARRAAAARFREPLVPTLLICAGSLAGLALTSWAHSDLMSAIWSQLGGSVDAETLSKLSPDREADHLAYRRHFTWLVLALTAAFIGIRRYWRQTARRPPPKPVTLVLAGITAVALGLMDFPWQVLWQADFPRVELAGERCYEVGEREEEVLLFCPRSNDTRTLVVDRNDPRLERTGIIESVFTVEDEAPGSSRLRRPGP